MLKLHHYEANYKEIVGFINFLWFKKYFKDFKDHRKVSQTSGITKRFQIDCRLKSRSWSDIRLQKYGICVKIRIKISLFVEFSLKCTKNVVFDT